MGRTQVESRVETLPYSWYADPAVAAAERVGLNRPNPPYPGEKQTRCSRRTHHT